MDSAEPRRTPSIVRVAAYIASIEPNERGERRFNKLGLFEGVPEVAQADRRMRDLRPMGWKIDNYKVNPNLNPDEYLLVEFGTRIDLGETIPKAARRGVTGPQRRRIIERDGHACQVCGIRGGDEFPDAPGRLAVLTIGHIDPHSRGGGTEDDNLRAECQRCNDESRDVTTNPPSKEQVLTHITNLGKRADKQRLHSWMVAGRRGRDSVDEAFIAWSRLPHRERLEILTLFTRQVTKD
jgi:hypothetical protein